YTLVDTYTGASFFDKFNYFTEEDPTGGVVEYINPTLPTTSHLNLTHATSTSIILRIDTSPTLNSTAAKIKSIRIESLPRYTTGLFIFDIRHTPHGCGLWPALWLSDTSENWPNNGEIDVLEATNRGGGGNVVSLHTGYGCRMVQTGIVTGHESGICDVGDGKANVMGCGVRGGVETYGSVFNGNGGGVYTLEIHPSGIKVWFFPRGEIPADITNAITNSKPPNNKNNHKKRNTTSNPPTAPQPPTWGPPLAHFPSTTCPIRNHFNNLQIIANIDLCGQNAGQSSTYTDQDGCPGTCEEYVRENVQTLRDAYWEFGGFWVFQ
ncbi:uncharacterized protein BO80DRAFT_333551, partial [Aspergillus ibericus CBS 121593]